MDHDEDDGVGFIADSHYLKSTSREDRQSAVALLSLPGRTSRGGSISSNISDIDVPIYSTDNLTTRPPRHIKGVSHIILIFILTSQILEQGKY